MNATQLDFEDGFLRNCRVDGKEVLRMIYFAVRDPNWQTRSYEIKNLEVHQNETDFTIQ